MIGFYPLVGFTLRSKKVITWLFNQVLKKKGLDFCPWVLVFTLESQVELATESPRQAKNPLIQVPREKGIWGVTVTPLKYESNIKSQENFQD